MLQVTGAKHHNQFCYLNSSLPDKLFHTFASSRTDNKDQIEFIIEKQFGETGSGQVYELQANEDGKPDGRLHEETNQRGGSRTDRIQTRDSRLRCQNARSTPGFIMANATATKTHGKKRASTTSPARKEKGKSKRIREEDY